MANFLEDLSIYNPKAAAAIAEAVLECNNEKANMMSGLKTTANDVTLSDETRLDALTALINLGNLLDIPLPPYFPSTVTYRNTQEYVGIHNNLEGLQGGAPGEYYHLTQAEKEGLLNKASIADITWDNLSGSYSDNEPFALLFDNKQEQLSAPSAGEFYVKINGTTIIYDNTPTIGSITGIVAGGELDGTYPNPTVKNVAVINKVLTGFDGGASTGTILPTDSILTAFQKLNANINNVINSPSGVSSVAFGTTAEAVFTTSSTSTGAVTLSLGLQNQNANLLFASPNGSVGQPSFRQLVNADLPNSGVSANTYGSAALIPRITVNAKGIVTGITEVPNPSGGQVNTVSITAPGFLSASSVNSAIPATPIITLAFSNQSINQVFAGPASGATGTPLFRSLVVDDIPQLPVSKIDGLDGFTGSFLSDSLGTSLMYIGNGSNKAVQAEVGGDIEALYSLINTTQTAVLTIKDEAVTYAKFQNIPDSALTLQRPILLGRFDPDPGVMQQMTLSNDFTINTTTGVIGLVTPNPPSLVDVGDLLTSTGSNNLVRLSLPSPNDGYLLMPYAAASSPACGLIWGLVDGDITYTVDDTTTPGTPFGAFSIGANKVTLGKIQQLPAYTVIGNATATNPNTPTALTKAELTTLVEQFNATNGGKVPATGGVGNTYFLNAAGGWSEVTGGGSPGGSNGQIQYKASASTFGGTTDMEYVSSTGVYATAAKFFLTNIASARNFSINFDVAALGGDYTWVFPDAGSEFVGTDVSQTLTNKTLDTGFAIAVGAPDVGTIWYSTNPSGDVAPLSAVGNGGKFLSINTSSGLPEWTGVTATSANNITGGVANQVLVQTAPNTTGFIPAPTVTNTYLKWNGTSIGWDTAGSGSGTVSNSTNANVLAYYSAAGTTVSPLAAITASRALVSNASGLPEASATTATEIGFVSGVTSGIQAQLNGKEPTITTLPVGKGGTGAITLTGLLRGNGTSAITGGALVGLTTEVSGTLTTSNGGTGVSIYTAGDILYYASGTTLTKLGIGSVGQILTVAAGSALTWSSGLINPMVAQGDMIYGGAGGVATRLGPIGGSGTFLGVVGGIPTWTTPTASTPLNQITAAAAGTATISHNASTVTWNWNSNTNNALVFNSSSIATAAILSVTSSSAYTGSGVVLISATGVTVGTILGVSHTTSALTGNVASFTSTTVTTGNVLNLGISGTTATSAKNLVITNTSTTANSTTRGLDIQLSGSNTNGNTVAAFISNIKGGTTSTTTALQLTASGGTTISYALDVLAGISRFAAGTASTPQLIITPSPAAGGTTFTGTTNGSLWYDTNTTNSTSSLYLYKDTSVTKLICKDRNEDFATGTSFGVIVANTQGSLFKSADLTALGIYAQTNNGPAVTGTTATSIMGTSIVGSTTLPANFFASGKTIVVRVAGTYQQAASTQACTIALKIGATNVCSVTIGHNNTIPSTGNYWCAEFTVTARGSGSGVALAYEAKAFLDTVGTANSGTPTMGATAPGTATLGSTAITQLIDITAAWSGASSANIIQSVVNTAYYLN